METKLCGFSGLNVLISNNQASKLLVNQIHTYSNVITLIIYTFIRLLYIYIWLLLLLLLPSKRTNNNNNNDEVR